MSWLRRVRSLPLRGRVLLTVLGAAVVALGASTYLSFTYWQGEALAAAEQQALLAAGSTRATVESALRIGRPAPARHSLATLRAEGTVTGARVYAQSGEILLSADAFEEGSRATGVWIPDAGELPRDGLVKGADSDPTVRVFLPLSAPEPAVLEVEFSVAATRAAMERGARLGIGLMAVSLLAVVVIVVTMFEREVVAPIHRMEVLLRPDGAPGRPGGGDVRGLERSLNRLIERERAVQAHAADRAGLAEVGELAAEMAHEFKRPLASVRTAVDVLQQEYELDERGHQVLSAVDDQLEHLYDTMQDLFSLAKPLVMEAEQVDVAATLDEALAELAGHPGAESVEVRRAYGDRGLWVVGDPRRLRQAFLNLATNAIEAMPEGGLLTVDARADGDGVVEVSFSDTGPGLDPEAVERALKPFYSTKPLGTGLGLPLVARIVAGHRGGLQIESLPKHGTTVRVRLPAAAQLLKAGG